MGFFVMRFKSELPFSCVFPGAINHPLTGLEGDYGGGCFPSSITNINVLVLV